MTIEDNEILWNVFNDGWAQWDIYINTGVQPGNPFKEDTPEFFSWNKGWNLNENGLDKPHKTTSDEY